MDLLHKLTRMLLRRYDLITQAEKQYNAALTQKALGILTPIARKYLGGAKMSSMATGLLGEPEL